jgi:N-acetylmuramoyl-L-alanine amidase
LKGSALRNNVQASPNVEARLNEQKPELIILHYTGMADGQAAVDWLCNPASKVSCHYLVDIDGRIVQMVDEELRAWHAGVSVWKGVIDTNSRSIGIEIQNPGHQSGCPAFPDLQMRRVARLCLDISVRHSILPWNILAHSDVAPGRKIDPGEAFDWSWLFEQGVGHITRANGLAAAVVDAAEVQAALLRFGYGLIQSGVWDDQTRRVVEAFQRHYRARKVDGIVDAETFDCLQRLLAARG